MPINMYNLPDAASLLDQLRKKCILVPERTKNRTTDATESWVIARLLSTLAIDDHLCFPLSVIHQDKPDIVIKQSEKETIGIEITEAITKEFAEYTAYAQHKHEDALINMGLFQKGAPKMTKKEKLEMLQTNDMSSLGLLGDKAEENWANDMLDTVQKKLDKLAHEDFQKYNQNWLAIYDNLPSSTYLEKINKAVEYLIPLLGENWNKKPNFDKVFIESSDSIILIKPEEFKILNLNDIWK